MSSGLTFRPICRHCSVFPQVFHIQVKAGSVPRMHSCHMVGLFIVGWRRCLTSAPGRTLSWRRLCPAAQRPRMLLPGRLDYVDIIGFEVIFRGDQTHRIHKTLSSLQLCVVESSEDVCVCVWTKYNREYDWIRHDVYRSLSVFYCCTTRVNHEMTFTPL